MDLYGIGFSNIRLSDDNVYNLYSYNYRINTFPEEIFLHEFLHTLERTSLEYGYNTIALHNYEDYGYSEEILIGLKNWYYDYMRCNVYDENTNEYVGLSQNAYVLKPVHETNFAYAIELNFNKEPNNVFDEIKSLFNVVIDAF